MSREKQPAVFSACKITSKHHKCWKYNDNAVSRRPCLAEYTHCQKDKRTADNNQMRAIVAIAADGRDSVALRREHPNEDVEPILKS
jgi:hypothetical protein